MNVLLLYPRFPDTFWSFRHALRFIRKESFGPPLGLLTVAAMLPPEWPKRLVDLNVTHLRPSDIEWADMVMISGMGIQRESARQIIARCKAAGRTVVAGGPLFTEEADQFDEVDHFVLNEAEVTLPRFLADLERGTPQRVYCADTFADMRRSPVPLWELADLRRYASACVQYSRGCPFDCEFCNITALLGRVPRTKSAEQIIAELDTLYRLGWRESIFFVDDNLIGDRRAAKNELLPALIRWRKDKVGCPFSTQVSINLADDEELLQMMVEAGFTAVFVGIETPCEESLTECHKTQNRGRDLLESVRRIQRAGMHVEGGFIVGFDSDTPSVFHRQIEFIQKSGIAAAMVGLLQAPHGTRLYERLKREGRLVGIPSGNNVIDFTNIIPKMGLEVLRDGYRALLQHIYSPAAYYERVRTFLKEYRPPRIRVHLDKETILAFFRSIYHLGIRGVERVHYWRLLFWTLFHRPRSFPMAVTLAIYGFHFRRICEEQVLRVAKEVHLPIRAQGTL